MKPVEARMLLRDLRSLEDCRLVVDLEKRVWEFTDPEDVVPVPILIVTVRRGGILIGAFDDDRMAGFVYSLAGLKHGKPIQWSHMLGVLPEYRNSGLGHRLKLEQRRRALDMGIDLIEWTFDPLQAMNAHFNFAKLGIVAEEYEVNIYGEMSSPLLRGTPTDRLVAQWWLRSPAVEQRAAVVEQRAGVEPGFSRAKAVPRPPLVHSVEILEAVPVNLTRRSGEWLECLNLDLSQDAARLLVEIPMGFGEMQAGEPDLARAWRLKTRELFTTYLPRGYRVVDFRLDRAARCGRYLLSR